MPVESVGLASKMQRVLISVPEASQSAVLAQDHAMTELSTMTTCRRTRLLENALSLPVVLWFVLIVGGVLALCRRACLGRRIGFCMGCRWCFFRC